jgi:hypothetical protein
MDAISPRKKAAGIQDLLPAVITFVLIAIVGAVGLLILASFLANGNVGINTAANNAISYGVSGISTIMSYLPLIALVIVAAIIIGIVLVAFAFRGGTGEKF